MSLLMSYCLLMSEGNLAGLARSGLGDIRRLSQRRKSIVEGANILPGTMLKAAGTLPHLRLELSVDL